MPTVAQRNARTASKDRRRPAAVAVCAAFLGLLVRDRPVFAWTAGQKVQTEESWEAVYIGNQKVGYGHSTVQVVSTDGEERVELRSEMQIRLKRFGTDLDVSAEIRSVEDQSGRLLEVEAVTKAARNEVMHVRGEAVGDKFMWTTRTFGRESKKEVPLDPEALGPYGQDQILKKLLSRKEGETAEFKFIDPELQSVVRCRVVVGDLEEVSLLDTKRKLRRFDIELYTPGRPRPYSKTQVWVDEAGDAWKSYMALLGGITVYRVSKEVALAEPKAVLEDFALKTLIPVKGSIERPYETARVRYRVRLREADTDLASLISVDSRQQLERQDERTYLLTVFAEPRVDREEPPGREFREANSYLQSDHEKVRALAQQAIGDASDELEKARRLERWVHENLREKNFSIGFATAAAVAESLEGDCTEHAVLLAAMARAVGLPSRVAVGVLYVESLGRFGGHMWTEMYVGGRWLPFDGTLGQGRLDGVHITCSSTSLAGADALVSLLPAAELVDRVEEFEVLEVEHWKDD